MIHINSEKCTSCGICGDVCPRHILETVHREENKTTVISPERRELCMTCGHCAAVCPEKAVTVDALEQVKFKPIIDSVIKADDLLTLMRQRRSVRRYRNKPVPRDIIDGLITAAQTAPTGTGQRTTGVIVIDNPEILKAFSESAYQLYEKLDRGLKNPVARFFIKRRIGSPMLHTLLNFVMPGMRWYIRWYREGKSNEILRDCPALMLFHSPVLEPMGAENCLIAAFHAIFMAPLLGLGTCFNDLIPPACNREPDIRRLLDLPEDREIYASITLGFPRYRFQRTIPRKLAEVRYL